MGRYPCMQAIIKAEQRFPSTQFTFTYVGDDDNEDDGEDDYRLLFLESKITSALDAILATISRLPIPAARMRAVKPYLLARFT